MSSAIRWGLGMARIAETSCRGRRSRPARRAGSTDLSRCRASPGAVGGGVNPGVSSAYDEPVSRI